MTVQQHYRQRISDQYQLTIRRHGVSSARQLLQIDNKVFSLTEKHGHIHVNRNIECCSSHFFKLCLKLGQFFRSDSAYEIESVVNDPMEQFVAGLNQSLFIVSPPINAFFRVTPDRIQWQIYQ